jgi:membrane protease YdiL (CAAX protease family)
MVRGMIRTVLAEFAAYCAHPHPIAPQRADWRRWGLMLLLYLAGLALLGTLVSLWQRALHLPGPEAFRGFSARMLIMVTVLIAPVGEEVAFRGWLTGRPRALWLLGVGLVAGALLVAVQVPRYATPAALGVVALVPVALAGWWLLRRRAEAPGWFVRGFGLWYWLSVAVFGLAHLSNYPRLAWALVPMVLPQLWGGVVFSYVRMRQGLVASMLCHAAGNATALAVALMVAG